MACRCTLNPKQVLVGRVREFNPPLRHFCSAVRSVRPWQYGDGYGATLRLHIGLEDVDDLLDDLAQGFAAMHAANQN